MADQTCYTPPDRQSGKFFRLGGGNAGKLGGKSSVLALSGGLVVVYHGYGGKVRLFSRHYSRIQHAAYSVWLGSYSEKKQIGMFTGYFDDSGSKDTATVVVGGFVSTIEQWLHFEREWKQVLADAEVPQFHMKEFAHSVGGFKGWRGKEKKRKEFLERLIGIILRRVHKSFCSVVISDAWRRVNHEYPFQETLGHPYSLAGESVVAHIQAWSEERGYEMPLLFFEDGSKHKGEFISRMDLWGINPGFGKKHEMLPLQAADLVAYESQKACSTALTGASRQFRSSFERLHKTPHQWGVYDYEDLIGVCKRFSLPKRADVSKEWMRGMLDGLHEQKIARIKRMKTAQKRASRTNG